MECLQLLLFFAVTGYCMAAPKPVEWDELGTKIHDFGARALPAIRKACGVFGSPQTVYPQFQGYYPPMQPYYPQFQGRGYPQAPNYPSFPNQNFYPQVGNNFPPKNLPPTTPEQNDLNRGVAQPKPLRVPPYIPPTEEKIFGPDSDEDYGDNRIPNAN